MDAPLDVRWSRELPSAPTSCTVTLDRAGRYHVSFVVEVDTAPLPSVNSAVGIDLGLMHFLSTSEGEKVGNPRFLQRDLDRLAKAQRKLAKKAKGSNNRKKAAWKVARLHAQGGPQAPRLPAPAQHETDPRAHKRSASKT